MLVGFPVYDGVNMLDVTGPCEMFSWTDIEVRLFAQTPGLVTFRGGLPIQVTAGFADAPAFDVIWVPGGEPDALARLMGDPARVYLDFLVRQSANARYVASVCEGALLLAAAGLLDGYEQMREFDSAELALIEPLRTLRLVHYSAWLARRWDDPAFPLAFPWFGSSDYWRGQVQMLEEQIEAMGEAPLVA